MWSFVEEGEEGFEFFFGGSAAVLADFEGFGVGDIGGGVGAVEVLEEFAVFVGEVFVS